MVNMYSLTLSPKPEAAVQEKNIVHCLWVQLGSTFLDHKSSGREVPFTGCTRGRDAKNIPRYL